MGKAFLDGYVGLAEGEKDPRNLMVAFAIARVILIEFDVSQHVEVCVRLPIALSRLTPPRVGILQHYLLLLSHLVPTPSKRPIWYRN